MGAINLIIGGIFVGIAIGIVALWISARLAGGDAAP